MRPSAKEEDSTPAAKETNVLRLDGHTYHNQDFGASSCKCQVVRDELHTLCHDYLYFI